VNIVTNAISRCLPRCAARGRARVIRKCTFSVEDFGPILIHGDLG
jgi:hypothetical protein